MGVNSFFKIRISSEKNLKKKYIKKFKKVYAIKYELIYVFIKIQMSVLIICIFMFKFYNISAELSHKNF